MFQMRPESDNYSTVQLDYKCFGWFGQGCILTGTWGLSKNLLSANYLSITFTNKKFIDTFSKLFQQLWWEACTVQSAYWSW